MTNTKISEIKKSTSKSPVDFKKLNESIIKIILSKAFKEEFENFLDHRIGVINILGKETSHLIRELTTYNLLESNGFNPDSIHFFDSRFNSEVLDVNKKELNSGNLRISILDKYVDSIVSEVSKTIHYNNSYHAKYGRTEFMAPSEDKIHPRSTPYNFGYKRDWIEDTLKPLVEQTIENALEKKLGIKEIGFAKNS
jgi:hypothetical protein